MKTSFLLLFISTLFLTSCSEIKVPEKKSFATSVVSTGAVVETDRILATVEGKNSANIAFKTSGRIANMFVNPGDIVKKGQILATLGNEEGAITSVGLSQVAGNLSDIFGSIDSLYASRLDNLANDEARAQIGVQIAEKDLELAKSTLLNSTAIFSGSTLSDTEKVSQAEKNLEYARNNLANSQKLLEIQGDSLQRNALSSMSNAFIIARNARDFIDETLGVTTTNKTKNDSFEMYLGAKNSTSKIQAEEAFRAFNTEYETMYTWYYTYIIGKTDISKETLSETLSQSLIITEHLRDLLHLFSGVLENSITSSTFLDSDLTGLKTKTTNFLSSLELAMLDSFGNGIKGSIAALSAFDSNYILKIQQLEDTVKLAEEDLNLAKTGKDTSSSDVKKNIDTLTTNVHLKEDALKLARITISEVEKNRAILNAERDSKLREIDAKLSETKMNKNLANNSMESGIIRAPFDGVILRKNVDIGSVVSAGISIFSISSTDGKILKTYFNSSLHPLKIGDYITIRLLESDIMYQAKVSLVNLHPDTVHDKAYFEAILSEFPGIVGNRVEIFLAKQINNTDEESVTIPLSAIITKYGEPGVYILEGTRAKFVLVTILHSDGKNVSITGLSV